MTLMPVSEMFFSTFQMSSFVSNVGSQYKLVPTNLSELQCDVFARPILKKESLVPSVDRKPIFTRAHVWAATSLGDRS
jgi:hypothetical protein